jgi:hypothetical protein
VIDRAADLATGPRPRRDDDRTAIKIQWVNVSALDNEYARNLHHLGPRVAGVQLQLVGDDENDLGSSVGEIDFADVGGAAAKLSRKAWPASAAGPCPRSW